MQNNCALEEAQKCNPPWKAWEPLPQRTSVEGTVRKDYSEGETPGTTSPTIRPALARLPLGEGRPCRYLRRSNPAALLRGTALWNGKDPILKERPLQPDEQRGSNHGEDVKEYYFYLDSTPAHSYMKFLYKPPQGAYPYSDLIETSRRRGRNGFEYELPRHGDLRSGPLLGRVRGVCQEHARGRPHPDPAALHPRPRGGRASRPSHVLGSATCGPGTTPTDRPVLQEVPGHGCASSGPSTACARAWDTSPVRGTSPYSSRRTRRTRYGSSASRTGPRTSRIASTTLSWTARGPVEPGEDRDQGGRPLPP